MSRTGIRLHLLILLPFLTVYLAISISLTWWSHQAGVHEAEDLGETLHQHVSARIRAEFDRLFDTPERLLAANVEAARSGLVALDNLQFLDRKFATQIAAFPNITALSWGSADGKYSCAYRDWTAPEQILVSSVTDNRGILTYRLRDDGQRDLVIGPGPGFVVTERPWYRAGFENEGPVWYPVYPYFSGQSLGVGIAEAIRDHDGNVTGVMAADLSLHQVARFLSHLQLKVGGTAFVMDEHGRLVADSTGSNPIRAAGPNPERVMMKDLGAAPVRLAAEHILADLDSIEQSGTNDRLEEDGQVYLLHAFRYTRPADLFLIGGIVVPRDAYSDPLTKWVHRRAVLALALIFVGFVLALAISRTITKPIRDLGLASNRIAAGEWQSEVPKSRIVEINSLAISFALMAENLRSMTGSLEDKVALRTTELAEANERLDLLSHTDQLTNLANRRRFDQELDKEWSRSQREQLPLSLLVCDVDLFKPYNDHYGHVAGDACLQALAAVLASTARRKTDLVARFGGEEFVAIFPGLDRESAVAIAEALRQDIEGLKIEHAASPTGCVTISIGVVSAIAPAGSAPGSDSLKFLEAADRALYAAKSNGRNRVEVAP